NTTIYFETQTDIAPEKIFEQLVSLPQRANTNLLTLIISDSNGKELIRFDPATNKSNDIPSPAAAPGLPKEVENNEQLFLIGQHLEQYRHATYSPVDYYEEALRRDPKDIRNNNALGIWYLRRGQFAKSERYFQKAVETSIGRNPNPYDGEPYYNLGLSFLYQNKTDEAYKSFYKAAWSAACQDAAYLAIAQIDIKKGSYTEALEHINFSLDRNARSSKAYTVKSAILRKTGKYQQAVEVCEQAINRDGFNLSARYELIESQHQSGVNDADLSQIRTLGRNEVNSYIEYALDYVACGLLEEALDFLRLAQSADPTHPMVFYHFAGIYHLAGDEAKATAYLEKAAAQKPDYCFPNKLEDIGVLQFAIENNAKDGFAPYYLGNLFYDKRQYTEAIALWEKSIQINPSFPTAFRNLGIAVFNKLNQHELALEYFEKAFALDPTDARILMEVNQLYKRLNVSPQQRLNFLLEHSEIAEFRDDVYLELAALYNLTGDYAKAFELIAARKFHPWEGGEGKVPGQYLFSLISQALENIDNENHHAAIAQLLAAQVYPENLGEGKLPDAPENDIDYWLGTAYEGLGLDENAKAYFSKATQGNSQPVAAIFYNDQQPDKIFYQGLGWKKLGDNNQAESIFKTLITYGETHQNEHITLDYFSVSLPDMLVFDADLNAVNQIHCFYMIALGHLGLEEYQKAEEYFTQILEMDKSHQGALLHAGLIKTLSAV
ncbi:MAG TPA: tetratricopeptide repeat protein, partial [Dyadobacter sp.]|nr:tetratricopeptide repeat protein [Dyadobacter sp.]